MNLYREQIIEHYKNPQNWGDLKNPDATAVGNNPFCGDVVNLKLKIAKKSLKDFKFTGAGCAISLAATSLLSEMVKGMEIAKVKKLTKEDIMGLLGINLGPVRMKCGLLCLDTLITAIKKYEGEKDK